MLGQKLLVLLNQLSKFETYFNLESLHKYLNLLRLVIKLSKYKYKLQCQNVNKRISDLKELLQIYSNNFNNLWPLVVADSECMKIGEPTLPRFREAPKTFNGSSQSHIFTKPEEYFKNQYLLAKLWKASLTQKHGSFFLQ